MELKKMRNKEKQILAAITADKEQQPDEQSTVAEIKRLKRKRIEQINRRINASYTSSIRFLNFRF